MLKQRGVTIFVPNVMMKNDPLVGVTTFGSPTNNLYRKNTNLSYFYTLMCYNKTLKNTRELRWH